MKEYEEVEKKSKKRKRWKRGKNEEGDGKYSGGERNDKNCKLTEVDQMKNED